MKKNLREPTINEIASEIGIAKEEIVYAMDAIQTPVSLFDPVYTEGEDLKFPGFPVYSADLKYFL